MEEKHLLVPYIVHESIIAKMERIIKRLWILCMILIVLLVVTNLTWIWYEGQFEEVVTTTTQEVQQDNNSGSNLFVGRDYGKTVD